jgi:hypothetical protein
VTATLRRTIAVEVVVALAFAMIVVAWGSRIALPVPLYLPGCVGDQCPSPNIPHVPLVSLAAGVVAVLITSRGKGSLLARLLTGIALGVVAAAYVGLVGVMHILFDDPYFTAPYQAYGLLFLAAATFLGIGFLWYQLRHGYVVVPRSDVLALVATAFVAGVSASAAGDLSSAGVVLASAASALIMAEVLRRRTLSRRPSRRAVVISLLAAAFGLRLVFGLQALARTGPGMPFALASDDGDSYYRLASQLAADPGRIGDILAADWFPPGYTLFVASLLALGSGSLVPVIAAQAILAALAGAVVFAIARDLAGVRVGIVALALFALDANLTQNQSTLTAEALLVPLALISLWAFVRHARERRLRWLVVAAAALAAAFVTRNVVAFPLLVSAVLFLGWSRRSWGGFARDAGTIILALSLATAPIAVASAIREGAPRFTTQAATIAWDFDGGGDDQSTISNRYLIDRGIRPFSDLSGSVARVVADPLPVVGFLVQAVPQRLSTLLFSKNYAQSDPLVVVNSIAYPNEFGDLVRIARLLGLLVAAVFAARLRAWRTHPELVLLGLFVVLYSAVFTFVFAPYHPFRYRIPIEPLRFIAEAAGVLAIAAVIGRAWMSRAQSLPLELRSGLSTAPR